MSEVGAEGLILIVPTPLPKQFESKSTRVQNLFVFGKELRK